MGDGWGEEVLDGSVLEGGGDEEFVEMSSSVEFLGHLCG
jgi:hypothetical protein